MDKILNFKLFLKESESSEEGLVVNDEVAESLIERSPILSALNKCDATIRISSLSNFYQSPNWVFRIKPEERMNGMIVSLGSFDFSSFIENLAEKEGIIISPNWFYTEKLKNEQIYLIFAQSDKVNSGSYTVDTWYATNRDSFLNIWEFGKVKEYVVEYNANSEDQLLKIIEGSIQEIAGIIEKIRVNIVDKKWPNEIKNGLKKQVKECYQKSVSRFLLEGKTDLIRRYSEMENIWIDLFKDDPNSIEFFIDLPENLRDKIIESPYLESLPETETLKGLKAQNKAKKLMKYI